MEESKAHELLMPSENLKYICKMWSVILRRKMLFFNTTMAFNFNNNAQIFNLDMLCGMGFLGGLTWQYWTSIALLQYYIDPVWLGCNFAPNFGGRDFYRQGELHRRIDGDCADIARKSANGLISMLLPDGFSSFKLKFEKTRHVFKKKGINDAEGNIMYLELKANEMLIEKLNCTENDFLAKITAMMFDYMSYGTSVGLLEMTDKRNCSLTPIPFLQAGLATTRYENIQIGLWAQPKPIMSMEIAGELDAGEDADNLLNGFIHHFYVSGDMIGKSKNTFWELRQTTRSNTMSFTFVPEEMRQIKKYKDSSPLLVARINDHGQMYGLGAGLLSLPTIKLANYFKNCAHYASMGEFFPAAAFAADSIVRQTSQTSGNPISDAYTEELCTMPGEKIYISSNMDVAQTGAPPMTNLSRPVEQTELFEMAVERCLSSVKNAYLITMIDRLTEDKSKSRDPTAIEIQAHMQADPHRFRAEVMPFYNKVVYPLVCAVADAVMAELFDTYGDEISAIRENDPEFLLKNSYEITIYNFEKKQKETERMQNMLTYAQIKAQQQEEMPDAIKKKIDSAFEEMIT